MAPMNRSDLISLYLHIPFCAHRCSYCDFNTYTTVRDLQDDYVTALAREVEQVAGDAQRAVGTVFFGGGTPSLLTPAQWARVLAAVNAAFDVAPTAEISIEANPNTVDRAYLSAIRELGVNRLSFGVQSAVSAELRLLDRIHDFDTVIDAVEAARGAGFDNINLDLIYGVPGQSEASWARSVEAVLALAPEHLSFYCLTIEDGTPMARWLDTGKMAAPDPDLAADQYRLACDRLAAAGYEHYEISNWARPGRACAHNLTYWRNGTYLGLGAGAHGHAAGYRYSVVRRPRTYLRRMRSAAAPGYPFSAALADRQQLSEADAIADTMITQLRLLDEGVSIAAFADRFGRTPADVYGETLQRLEDWGLLREAAGSIRLTEQGWFLSNQVFHRLV